MESPPSSKKLSLRPTSCERPSIFLRQIVTAFWVLVTGGTYFVLLSKTGSGRALLSIFPLGVVGITSSLINIPGII